MPAIGHERSDPESVVPQVRGHNEDPSSRTKDGRHLNEHVNGSGKVLDYPSHDTEAKAVGCERQRLATGTRCHVDGPICSDVGARITPHPHRPSQALRPTAASPEIKDGTQLTRQRFVPHIKWGPGTGRRVQPPSEQLAHGITTI